MGDIFDPPRPDSQPIPVEPAAVSPEDIARIASAKRKRRTDYSDLVIDPAVNTPQNPTGTLVIHPTP